MTAFVVFFLLLPACKVLERLVEIILLHDISYKLLTSLLSMGVLSCQHSLLELLDKLQHKSISVLTKQHLNSTCIFHLFLLPEHFRSLGHRL